MYEISASVNMINNNVLCLIVVLLIPPERNKYDSFLGHKTSYIYIYIERDFVLYLFYHIWDIEC